MFFARRFDIWSVSGIAIIEVMAMVIRIVVRSWKFSCVSWAIVAAAPVLDFRIRKRVTNDIDITNVLIDPRRIRNCSLFSFPIISEPMIAA